MKNQGTLVGAPVRVNDDQDKYPVALQREVRGGHHNRTSYTDLAVFPDHLKEVGMTCYVAENGKTYQLANDLVTWNVFVTPASSGGGGTTGPGTGGNNSTATIISGNFGEWTDLPGKSANIFDEQLPIQFKTDLSAFPTRAITYLAGQFGLDSAFVGTELTIGTLPANNRPKARLKKWMACKGIELYLVIETSGAVKLLGKDGFNLPVATAGTENDPYFIDVFFSPDIAVIEPVTYTYTRTENFERDNCGAGSVGETVSFSKTYTSNVSLADAQNVALSDDANYRNLGRAKANADGSCTLQKILGTVSVTAERQSNSGFGNALWKLSFRVGLARTVGQDIIVSGAMSYVPYRNNVPGGTSMGPSFNITVPAGQTSASDDSSYIELGFNPNFETIELGDMVLYNIGVLPETIGSVPVEITFATEFDEQYT